MSKRGGVPGLCVRVRVKMIEAAVSSHQDREFVCPTLDSWRANFGGRVARAGRKLESAGGSDTR